MVKSLQRPRGAPVATRRWVVGGRAATPRLRSRFWRGDCSEWPTVAGRLRGHRTGRCGLDHARRVASAPGSHRLMKMYRSTASRSTPVHSLLQASLEPTVNSGGYAGQLDGDTAVLEPVFVHGAGAESGVDRRKALTGLGIGDRDRGVEAQPAHVHRVAICRCHASVASRRPSSGTTS